MRHMTQFGSNWEPWEGYKPRPLWLHLGNSLQPGRLEQRGELGEGGECGEMEARADKSHPNTSHPPNLTEGLSAPHPHPTSCLPG